MPNILKEPILFIILCGKHADKQNDKGRWLFSEGLDIFCLVLFWTAEVLKFVANMN
uniref:hypothetical protein n=1 Tax=Coprococcus catus TaxID=116085 RepID=UPI0022DF2F9A|nr:hypothetical protein [Coprococcus catus]